MTARPDVPFAGEERGPRSGAARRRAPRRRRPVALLALVVALALPVDGGAVTPGRRWRTLETPHFLVHFHEGLYPLALRAARSLEAAHGRLVPLLGAEPNRRTEVVLSDDSDDANGWASASLRPNIHLLAEPPDDLSVLGDYDDYVYLLVAHEYVHVLHLGAMHGLPRALSWLLGDLYLPNAMQPRFILEGLATYQESHLTGAGRLRSALFEMYLRADVLEDRLLSLGELTGSPLRWPGGTAAYLYGGHLLGYLAETRGDEALAAYVEAYGRSLVPFDLNLSLHEASGVDWIELYEEWSEELRRRFGEQAAAIRSRGPITVPEVATSHGFLTRGPRWARTATGAGGARSAGPAGAPAGDPVLYYVEVSPHRRPHLRALEVATGRDREIHDLGATGELAPLPDGRVLVARPERYRTYRSHGELFLVDGDGERQLTRGLRASEPDVSPDGRTAYFVRRDRGRTVLASLSLDDPEALARVVYEPPEGREIFTPRVSPDGGTVALSLHRAGRGRDVVLVEVATGGVRFLTDDGFTDLDPAFAPDGREVVFASDRDGVFNLYAVPVAGGPARRLTNVLTGAFQPEVSPDGSWLAWTTYSSRGFDVAAARWDAVVAGAAEAEEAVAAAEPAEAETAASDLATEGAAEVETTAAVLAAEGAAEVEATAAVLAAEEIPGGMRAAPTAAEATAAEDAAPGSPRFVGEFGALYPVAPYRPLRTLGPDHWMPYLSADPGGTVVGALTSGSDVVGLHAWAASAGLGIGSREPQGGLAYGYRGLYPDLDAAVAAGHRAAAGFADGTTERFASGSVAATVPFATTRRSHALLLGYEATRLDPVDVPDPADAPAPGLATEVQLGWSYSSAERPFHAISPENGLALSARARLGAPALGGDFSYAAATLGAGAYLRLPWARHHVLALTAAGALGTGDLGERRVFSLGGPVLRDPLLDLLYTGALLSEFQLRGYRAGAFSGNQLVLGTVEYRLPLLRVGRGPYTLPFSVGRWSGAVFAEAGGAADRLTAEAIHPAVGVESRLELSVGYGMGFALRAGFAHGLHRDQGGGSRIYLGVGLPY